jgi:hypothetical protein
MNENSTEVSHLYQEFAAFFRANDDEAVRRIYRELLLVGRPRAEIVREAERLASSRGGLDNPATAQGTARAPAAEAPASIDRIAQVRTGGAVLLDVTKQNLGPQLLPGVDFDPGVNKGRILRSLECTSDAIAEITQDELSSQTTIPERDLKIVFLPRSAIARLVCAFSGMAVLLVAALALLPNPSTAEKTVPSVTPAGPHAASPKNPATPTESTISSASSKDRQGPPDLAASTLKLTTGAVGRDTSSRMNPTATSPSNQVGVAAEPVGAPTPLPVIAGSVQVASISSLRGKQPQTIWVPQTVPSVSDERDALASRDVLGSETAPGASSSPRIASKHSLLLPSGDEAVLLTRGDSLFRTGDLASARLFYERAANAGSGQAALRLGESYDPHFLEKTHLRGARSDIETAILWYKRARDLGASEATILLDSIASK